MPPMQIGPTIRRRRDAMGLSQQVFATRAGISTPVLNKTEQGKTSPTLATLQGIARALGTTVAVLVAEAEEEGGDVVELPVAQAPAAVADPA